MSIAAIRIGDVHVQRVPLAGVPQREPAPSLPLAMSVGDERHLALLDAGYDVRIVNENGVDITNVTVAYGVGSE